MKFTNLEECPSLVEDYLQLVENNFSYQKPYSYQIDFYPLVNNTNYKNCYMLIDNNKKIIATCAYQYRSIEANATYNICFMGSICVNNEFQRQGFGKKIVEHCLSKVSHVDWVGLWSDKKIFFQKLGFCDFGDQYFIPIQYLESKSENIVVKKMQLNELDCAQMEQWKKFYIRITNSFITVSRNEQDWINIKHISSATYLDLSYQNKTIGYAIVHKGMDLQNVVHEFYVEDKYVLPALHFLNQTYALWLPFFNYNWDESFIGPNLMIRPMNILKWQSWENEIQQSKKNNKHLFVSGLDSV